MTDASPTAVTVGHDVTDVAGFQVDPQGQVAFFVCPASATDCVRQGSYEGVEPLAPDAGGGSSAALTYSPTAPGNYCFFDIFHNSDGIVPESTDDSAECFTVTKAASGPPTVSSSSSSSWPQSQPGSNVAGFAAPAAGPSTAAASGPGVQSPIPVATSVHTGEPWAGALPVTVGPSGFGLVLMGCGTRRRRQSANS